MWLYREVGSPFIGCPRNNRITVLAPKWAFNCFMVQIPGPQKYASRYTFLQQLDEAVGCGQKLMFNLVLKEAPICYMVKAPIQ